MSKIYIVSLSPSIDYIVNLSHFTLNATNRPSSTDMYAAGKGTHVSMFMQNFNIDNELILFLNGYHEKYYLDQMKNLKIKTKVFHSNSDVRINLKLIDNTTQTECSVNAPEIENSEFQKMLNYLKRNVKPNDIVVTTGSIPKNMGVDTYEQIAMVVSQNKGLNVVDAFGPVLLNAIKQPFWLIKPNWKELETTLQKSINSIPELIKNTKNLFHNNQSLILVSNGKNGGILITPQNAYVCSIPKTKHKLVNAAGAGDSMLAGFIVSYLQGDNLELSLKKSIISGSATAFSERIATRSMVEQMLKDIKSMKVKQIKIN